MTYISKQLIVGWWQQRVACQSFPYRASHAWEKEACAGVPGSTIKMAGRAVILSYDNEVHNKPAIGIGF